MMSGGYRKSGASTPPQPAPPYSASPQSELRNRRSSSISITSRTHFAEPPSRRGSNHSRNNSSSLTTGVARVPSVDWQPTWDWPRGTSGTTPQLEQVFEAAQQWTHKPERYPSRRSSGQHSTDRNSGGPSIPIRTRSRDLSQSSSGPSVVPASRRSRTHTLHSHQPRHLHLQRVMSRPTSAQEELYADSHDFDNDGDGEADRGMTEGSSGFLTSDNEFTDEPESFGQRPTPTRRDFAMGGQQGDGKFVDEPEEIRGAHRASARTSAKTHRLKRPIRKSSIKTLIPSAPSSTTSTTSSRKFSDTSFRQRLIIASLIILGLFLLGTVIVLSTIQRYFRIEDWAYLSENEIGGWTNAAGENGAIPPLLDLNSSRPTSDSSEYHDESEEDAGMWGPNGRGTGGYWMQKDWDGVVRNTESWDRLYNVSLRAGERMPRIIHQTWKSDVLPEKWRKIWMECREGMPDYEYMLWTDDQSRRFISEKYPQFLAMFDGYEYPIQRADAIRYFILHHFGGIYMDLDIGCKRRLEPLISGDWDVILPRTKPVGVSNDLIFSARRHPFMEATIHGLIAFDHRYVTNYPTVMFSTGPMFLSAQYGLYSSAHPLTPVHPRPQIRILPKSLYGKNAKPEEAPHSFFAHYYGSSWHADDAGFITFLGKSGKLLMYAGMAVFVFGGLWYCFIRRSGKGVRSGKRSLRRLIVGDVIGGGSGQEGGAYHMVSLLPTSSAPGSRAASPTPHTSSDDDTITSENTEDGRAQAILDAVRRAGNFILAAPATLLTSNSRRGQNQNDNARSGVLYFLPAFFAPLASSESASSSGQGRRARTASMASMLPATRTRGNGVRRSRRSSHTQSRLESGNYHQPQSMSLPHQAVQEEDERYLSGEDTKMFTDPPPSYAQDPSMAEVDPFLKSQERST